MKNVDENIALKWRGKLAKEYWGYYFFYVSLKILGLNVSYFILSFIVIFYTIFNKRARNASNMYFNKLACYKNSEFAENSNQILIQNKKQFSFLEQFALQKLVNSKNWFFSFIRSYIHFYRFGQILLDRTYITLTQKNPFNTYYSAPDQFLSTIHSSKGVLIIGSHIGSFEYAGSLMKAFNKTTYLMMLKIHEERLKKFLDKLHKKRAYKVIDLKDPFYASQKAIKELKNNSVVCVMGDRDLEKKSSKIDFLNTPSSIPLGPFHLASFAEVPVIFIFCVKENKNTYKVHNFGPFEIPNVTNAVERKKYATYLAEEFVNAMEKIVNLYPYQWFNFYDFWD